MHQQNPKMMKWNPQLSYLFQLKSKTRYLIRIFYEENMSLIKLDLFQATNYWKL